MAGKFFTTEPPGHNRMLVSHKKERNTEISNMGGNRIIMLSEVSQTVKDKYITYLQNLKNNSSELIHKTETDAQTQKTNMVQFSSVQFSRSVVSHSL